MNSGVYCRPKSSNNVHNAIIIDKFNKIFGNTESKESMENKYDKTDSLEPTSCSTNLSEEEQWQCGTNVRAPYSEDGELYEAIIEKIFDEYAIVRYLGYENEEAVKLKDLRPSLGEESITEQIGNSKLFLDDEEEEEDEDAVDFEPEDDEWKVGMQCRALYQPNEVVYEAVIQEVNSKERKAVVIMSGYGIPYEVSFDNMYETIPELRIKQERTARTHLASKMPSADEIVSSNIPDPLTSSVPNIEARSSLPGMSCNVANCQGMVQPENENDALACLLSSNYLSGYYAGYFDCLKKLQNLKK
ncbi:survival motor neuron protein-like [Planococcus citri]|uniref:survival motor neuron protein-like n=1 Tax=Planococcus citri TaxID=170843 RepID=UPI0031F80018